MVRAASSKNVLCLNAATIKAVDLDQQIDIASSCGFGGIGLWVDDVQACVGPNRSLSDLSAKIEDVGLEVTELCFLGLYKAREQRSCSPVFRQAEDLCRMAQSLKCQIVVAVSAMTADYVEITPKDLCQVCDVAAAHDVRIALEFPGTAAEIRNLATAWKVVRESQNENLGLVIDTFHFLLGGSRMEDMKGIPAEKIFLVHVSDAMDVSDRKLRTHHDYRTFPGDGIIDYDPLLQELAEKDYQGAFSLEIWNQKLLESDAREVAGKGFESLKNLMRRTKYHEKR